jgi:DnaA family protein
MIHPQLPLGLEPGERYTFDTLVPGKNDIAVGLARQLISHGGEKQLYFWGEQGSGKSHLLQACCHLAARQQLTVCYLTASEIAGQSAELFDGLEQINVICLDDLSDWLNDQHLQLALFDLINRVRESGSILLMASRVSPEASAVSLPDLRSRLSWGPVFQLTVLDDLNKIKALQFQAEKCGLQLPTKVAEYLIHRYPRDMSALFSQLEQLDRASMAMQRRLTIPLVKSVLEPGSK